MSTVDRSCINCRHEDRGYCEWARSVGDFCPPWVSDGMAIVLEGGNEMGAICNVWELREEPWEK